MLTSPSGAAFMPEQKGMNYLVLLKTQDIYVINEGDVTFSSRQFATESAIDISLTDCQSFSAYKCCIGDEPRGSSHYSISLSSTKEQTPGSYIGHHIKYTIWIPLKHLL
jgi:hypothetical protein